MPIKSGVTVCVDVIFVSVEIVRTMQLNPNRQERDRIFSNIFVKKDSTYDGHSSSIIIICM